MKEYKNIFLVLIYSVLLVGVGIYLLKLNAMNERTFQDRTYELVKISENPLNRTLLFKDKMNNTEVSAYVASNCSKINKDKINKVFVLNTEVTKHSELIKNDFYQFKKYEVEKVICNN